MNIWYINHYGGGPSIARGHRAFHLAKAWASLGHETTIIVASFHHLLEKPGALARKTIVAGVVYHALPARTYSGNGVARVRNMVDFTRGVARLARSVPEELNVPDAIIVSSPHPFAIYPARKLARRYGAKLVFEIRDIWPLSITEINGTPAWHPFVIACAHAERFALRHADVVASLMPRANQHVAEVGGANKRFVWVPNGVPGLAGDELVAGSVAPLRTDFVPGARAACEQIDSWRAQGRVVIVHAGSMGPPNGLELLLDAVDVAKADGELDKFGVLLIGDGALKEKLARVAREQGLSNVAIFPSVPKADVGVIVAHADIGYAGLKNIPNLYRFGIALNKIFDYTQAGLPIVVPIAPCGDVVSQSGCGIARAVETPRQLWEALRELIEMPQEARDVMGAKGRAYTEVTYNFDVIAKKYIDAMC